MSGGTISRQSSGNPNPTNNSQPAHFGISSCLTRRSELGGGGSRGSRATVRMASASPRERSGGLRTWGRPWLLLRIWFAGEHGHRCR
jgi:hypothetical protein